MSTQKQGPHSPEVRERAVRLVREQPPHASQRAAITALAPKLGCTKETLRRWVRDAEREVKALQRTNQIVAGPARISSRRS